MRNCWHHDDFLFETQFPTTGQAKNPTAGNELLERFLRRLRMQTPFTRRPQPQTQPQAGVAGTDISPLIVAAFQSVWKELQVKLSPPSS
jgi:hypothetical protein